jgi:hypothetical protein
MKQLLALFILFFTITSCNSNADEKKTNSSTRVKNMNSPASDSCAEPYLFTDKNGTVYLSWVEKKGRGAALKFSFLSNDSWSAPATIASGKNWFVNWADYPVITTDGDKNFLAHFLEKSDTAKFTYDIKIVSSGDMGKSWNEPVKLHNDNVKAEHGFVSMTPYKNGFFVCWLDGRKTAMEGMEGHHDGHHGEMTVRAAVLDKTGKKINEWELDGRVCDCCQTTAAITDNGPVVIYRDRSGEEIRDMSIVRLENDQWTAPQKIYSDNWKIAGCPVNGPSATALGNNLAVAWFSMPDKKPQVNIVFSKDGGETFSNPIRIDECKPIGRVDVVMPDEKTAIVAWMEGPAIKAVKVHADGTKESSLMIASSSESRAAGFPQMTRSGNKIYFAWTDDKAKTVRVAAIDL